ncbi:TetR/AcrR family transcriptional regulator [Alkalibacter rhizosphaerae]|uniref:TetR/AcrR family transcriptional regulator n=1 Tax=Alkalibacter rhizosphaerae TaxID=2815577 RepID=A0A974XGA0_9FIRM|nr:TetR/AcrR family transcriptional regulator [Alkalibacter rhizosphaerae]QSX08090.1 TetR/AcrR family transcriptional regulator [Alkalibacter rhizosphaerae]
MPTPKKRQKIKKSQLTKNKLLEVSNHLFYEKGYEGTKIRELTRLAEVNHSLIYYYFPNGKVDIAYKLIVAHEKKCLQALRKSYKAEGYLMYTLVYLRFVARELLQYEKDMDFYIQAWSEFRPVRGLFIENYTAANEVGLTVDAPTVEKATLMGDSIWSGMYKAKQSGAFDFSHKEIRDATDITRWVFMGYPMDKIKQHIEKAEGILKDIPLAGIRLLEPVE